MYKVTLRKVLSFVVAMAFAITSVAQAAPMDASTLRQPSSAVKPSGVPEEITESLSRGTTQFPAGGYTSVGDIQAIITEALASRDLDEMAAADTIMRGVLLSPDVNSQLKMQAQGFLEPKPGKPVIRVVRAKPEKSREVEDFPQEEKQARNREPFDINSKGDFLKLANEVFPALVKKGIIKPVVLINIKQFSEMSSVAYGEYLSDISSKYNGNITFILIVEDESDLKHDLPAMVNAVNMTADALGEDFIRDNFILSMLDGGLKERWANLTPRYGQCGTAPARIGDNYIEQNIKTLGALSLSYPKIGYDDIFNIGSDSDVMLGNVLIGKKPKELNPDRNMIFYGVNRPILDETQIALIASYLAQGKSWQEIYQMHPVQLILRDIENRQLDKRGVFFIDADGKLSLFAEKIPASEILKQAYEHRLSDDAAALYENLWLVTYGKIAFLRFARKLKDTPVSEEFRQKSGGRITNLSQLEVSTFQIVISSRFMNDNDSKWNEICNKLLAETKRPVTREDLDKLRAIAMEYLPTDKIYGGNYGKGSEAEDTGNLGNTLKVWQKERGKGKINTAYVDTQLTLGSGVTLEDSLISGSGKLIIGNGAVIKNSHIHVSAGRTITIPQGAVIVDSYLQDNVNFIKGEGGYLVIGVWFAPNQARELSQDGIWRWTDALDIYPDESITTIRINEDYYIIRDIISVDFKGKSIGTIIPQEDWDVWNARHPHILGIKGVSESWPFVKDMEFIGLRKYPDSDNGARNDIAWARKNVDLLVQQRHTVLLRSEMQTITNVAKIISQTFKIQDEAELRHFVEVYNAETDHKIKIVMDSVINAMLFSSRPEVRWSARWVKGELIGIPIQSMFERENRAAEVVYRYLAYFAVNKQAEYYAINNIIHSALSEPKMSDVYQSAKWASDTIRKVKRQIENTRDLTEVGKSTAIDSVFNSEPLRYIKNQPWSKGLWACLSVLIYFPDISSAELRNAFLDLIDAIDRGEFKELSHKQITDRIIYTGTHIKVWTVSETTEAVTRALEHTRPDIPLQLIRDVMKAHIHPAPKPIDGSKRIQRLADQVVYIHDLMRSGRTIFAHNPYEKPGQLPNGTEDITEIIAIVEDAPGALGREATSIGRFKGNITGDWHLNIDINGKKYVVLVFEIEKEKLGGGRFKDLAPIVQQYLAEGANVFVRKINTEGKVGIAQAAATNNLADSVKAFPSAKGHTPPGAMSPIEVLNGDFAVSITILSSHTLDMKGVSQATTLLKNIIPQYEEIAKEEGINQEAAKYNLQYAQDSVTTIDNILLAERTQALEEAQPQLATPFALLVDKTKPYSSQLEIAKNIGELAEIEKRFGCKIIEFDPENDDITTLLANAGFTPDRAIGISSPDMHDKFRQANVKLIAIGQFAQTQYFDLASLTALSKCMLYMALYKDHKDFGKLQNYASLIYKNLTGAPLTEDIIEAFMADFIINLVLPMPEVAYEEGELENLHRQALQVLIAA